MDYDVWRPVSGEVDSAPLSLLPNFIFGMYLNRTSPRNHQAGGSTLDIVPE